MKAANQCNKFWLAWRKNIKILLCIPGGVLFLWSGGLRNGRRGLPIENGVFNRGPPALPDYPKISGFYLPGGARIYYKKHKVAFVIMQNPFINKRGFVGETLFQQNFQHSFGIAQKFGGNSVLLSFLIRNALKTVFIKLDDFCTRCSDQNRGVGGDDELGSCFRVFMQHPDHLELAHGG